MKQAMLLIALTLGLFTTVQAEQAQINGLPMKAHHLNSLGSDLECSICHNSAIPSDKPSSDACISCHGTMDEIPTQPNRYDKNPHHSHHYENTLECTACHSEHKASHALCADCHKVEFKNFK